MAGNRGKTSLRCRNRARNPMQEFDRLPPQLRAWVATASLPWTARSVRHAYEKALAQTGDTALALQALDKVQNRLIAKDAPKIWGAAVP